MGSRQICNHESSPDGVPNMIEEQDVRDPGSSTVLRGQEKVPNSLSATGSSRSTSTEDKTTTSTATNTSLSFPFVNIANPTRRNDTQTKKFVRAHAARRSGKKSVDVRRNLPLRPLLPLQAKEVASSAGVQDHGADTSIRKTQKVTASSSSSSDVEDGGKSKRLQKSSKGRVRNDESGEGRGEILHSAEANQLLVTHYHPNSRYNDVLDLTNGRPSPLVSGMNSNSTMYPIEMDDETFELVQFSHRDHGFDKVIPAFRPIWFGMVLRDAASFLQNLSTNLAHKNIMRGLPAFAGRAIHFQQQALQSVNKRLSDPVASISDGIIGSVISFLTFDNIIADIERYRIDKAGLARMIELRGGISTLENNPEVRLMILWDDVCGACHFDIPPTYGLPTHHLPPVPTKPLLPVYYRFQNLIWTWNRLFPENPTFTQLLLDLHILNSIICVRYPDILNDPWFLGLHLNPLLLRLLMPGTDASNEGDKGRKSMEVVETAARLAALVYMADVRVLFMVYHVTGYHFLERLKPLLLNDGEEWRYFQELRLWALVISGIKATPEDRNYFVAAILLSFDKLGTSTWEEVMHIVRNLLWIDDIYGDRAAALGNEVMSRRNAM